MDGEKKLLFFDIDGTLIMSGHKPGKAVVSAIQSARRNGHLAFLSTGRTEQIVPSAIMDIGFDGAIYSAGGRVVVEGIEITNHTMPEGMVEKIIGALEMEKELFYTLECGAGNFHGNVEHLHVDDSDLEGGSTELRRVIEIMRSSGSRTVSMYAGEPVYKVSFFCVSSKRMDRVADRLSELGKVVRFDNMLPGSELFSGEVTGWGIDKGRALGDICDYYGTTADQCIAFGDSMNDAEILLAAGVGVAMGNAEPQVKKLADRVCESCKEDGVAKELYRLGLA